MPSSRIPAAVRCRKSPDGEQRALDHTVGDDVAHPSPFSEALVVHSDRGNCPARMQSAQTPEAVPIRATRRANTSRRRGTRSSTSPAQ